MNLPAQAGSNSVCFVVLTILRCLDHSTLCRFRNWLVEGDHLEFLMGLINSQLEDQGLKVHQATTAVVDVRIIQTAGKVLPRALDYNEETGEVENAPPSSDKDARWTKKGKRFHPGYKQHVLTDSEGYVDHLTVTAANVHDSLEFENLLDRLTSGTRVFADKGYSSTHSRELLEERGLKKGIMFKAFRNKALKTSQTLFNKIVTKYRYVVEQCFGTQKRLFHFDRARYFGRKKVEGQAWLKAMCINLLKAGNRIRIAI